MELRPLPQNKQATSSDFKLTPLCNEILVLLGFYTAWIGSFFIDVLGQPVGPFFKGQTV
jgi:hypothetical protein